MESKLFDEHKVWAVKIAKSYAKKIGVISSRLLPGEVEQAALLGLLHATNCYDEKLCKGFQSYAYACIIGTVKKELRKNRFWNSRTHISPDICSISADESRAAEHISKLQFNDKSQDGYLDLIRHLKNDRIRECVIRHCVREETYEEIGKSLGLSHVRIHALVQRGLNTIRLGIKSDERSKTDE